MHPGGLKQISAGELVQNAVRLIENQLKVCSTTPLDAHKVWNWKSSLAEHTHAAQQPEVLDISGLTPPLRGKEH